MYHVFELFLTGTLNSSCTSMSDKGSGIEGGIEGVSSL